MVQRSGGAVTTSTAAASAMTVARTRSASATNSLRFLRKGTTCKHQRPKVTPVFSSSSSSSSSSSRTIDWENDVVSRNDVTELIVFNRIKMNVTWSELASSVNKSKEWTTSACLGQHSMSKSEAEKVGTLLHLPPVAVKLLQTVPYKGSLPTQVPTDPLIYRFYELVNVYGTTFKELIHEEFGDGIMSAIDFNMDLQKTKGELDEDRVTITMSGKYLPYKKY